MIWKRAGYTGSALKLWIETLLIIEKATNKVLYKESVVTTQFVRVINIITIVTMMVRITSLDTKQCAFRKMVMAGTMWGMSMMRTALNCTRTWNGSKDNWPMKVVVPTFAVVFDAGNGHPIAAVIF